MREDTDTNPAIIRFGVFEVDLRAGEFRRHGLKVKLQEQPLQVLAMLLEHAGDVVTREELQKKIWPGDTFVDFDHGLNKAINKIREALADSADSPRFIETLPRRGYRFIAQVEKVGADLRVCLSTKTHAGASLRERWLLATGGVLLAIALLTLGLNVAECATAFYHSAISHGLSLLQCCHFRISPVTRRRNTLPMG